MKQEYQTKIADKITLIWKQIPFLKFEMIEKKKDLRVFYIFVCMFFFKKYNLLMDIANIILAKSICKSNIMP